MYAALVKALVDTNGPDISGKIVPMLAGTAHQVSKHDLNYFKQHPDVFTVLAEDIQPAVMNADGTGFVDPVTGVATTFIKMKRASGSLVTTTVATGATPTHLPINAASDDVHGLIDALNDHINVPSDAVAYVVRMQGFFAPNATGSDRTVSCDGWVANVVWVAQTATSVLPHASATPTAVLAGGQLSIDPVAMPKLRFSAKQDSGGNLTFTPTSFTIEFICG